VATLRQTTRGSIVFSVSAVAERALLVAMIVTLCWIMNWVYVQDLVVGHYGDAGILGYPFAQHGQAFRWLCWGIGVLPSLWMPITPRRASQVLVWCMYLMLVLPTAVIGSYANQTPPDILAMLSGITIGLTILSAVAVLPLLRIPEIRANTHLFWLAIGLFIIASDLAVIRTYGSTFRVVTLAEVYTQRAVAMSIDAGLLTRYAMLWQALVVNPLLMAIGTARRRPFVYLVGLAGEIFLFGVAAQRILLAMPFLVYGFHVLLRGGARRFGRRATAGSLVVFVVPLLLISYGVYGGLIAALVFQSLLNRLFLNSGFISTLYFKFFQTHPHVWFAEVKPFSWFLHSPYQQSYPVALGWYFWGFENDPNANLFADGYAQLGYAGLFIEALALAVAFWLLDSVVRQRKMSIWFVAMLCAGQIGNVTNGATSTIVLGGGFALLVAVLAILPDSEAVPERDVDRPNRVWRRGSIVGLLPASPSTPVM
jgi:hypothetical protein